MHSRTQGVLPMLKLSREDNLQKLCKDGNKSEKKKSWTQDERSSITVVWCEVQDREKQYSEEVYIPFKTNIYQFCNIHNLLHVLSLLMLHILSNP